MRNRAFCLTYISFVIVFFQKGFTQYTVCTIIYSLLLLILLEYSIEFHTIEDKNLKNNIYSVQIELADPRKYLYILSLVLQYV